MAHWRGGAIVPNERRKKELVVQRFDSCPTTRRALEPIWSKPFVSDSKLPEREADRSRIPVDEI
jgi:hypothetical protein